MLKKVLRYDIKYMRRSWTVFAAIALLISFVSSLLIRHSMYIEEADEGALQGVAALEIMLAMLGIMFVLATGVILIVRIFTRSVGNFFSDAGYLTFTLPVSRKTLYHAKILNGLIWILLQGILMLLCLLFFVTIPSSSEPWAISLDFFKNIFTAVRMSFEREPLWFTVIALELITLWFIMPAFETLFIHYCVIRGGTGTGRGKAGAATGIFLGSIFGVFFAFVLFVSTSAEGILYLTSDLDASLNSLVTVLFLLLLICLFGGLGTFFYFSSIDRLENKLNLS